MKWLAIIMYLEQNAPDQYEDRRITRLKNDKNS